jgi:hypothetical protein
VVPHRAWSRVEEHWHGVEPENYLFHLAMSLGKTEWLAEVTDQEYRRGFR